MMNIAAATKIHETIPLVPFFYLEDIFITGMCTRKASIRLIDEPGIVMERPKASGSAFLNVISGHRYSVTEIRQIHRQLSDLTRGLGPV